MRLILVAATLLAAALPAFAADVRVDRIEIVDKGTYTVTVGDKTPDPNAPGEVISAPDTVTNIADTTTVPGKLGSEFGFQYRVVGEPAGADVSLDMVFTYPAPGLVDPAEAKPLLETRFTRVKKVGEIAYLGYGIENDWEIVPGTWTFAIWFDDKKLAEQSFTVTR